MMNIPNKDKDKIVKYFFILVNANYGSSYHHIGDGDSLGKDEAKEIRLLLKKYANDFWDENNAKMDEYLNQILNKEEK